MDVARTRDGRRVDAGWTRAAEKKWFAGVRREIPFAPNPVSFSAMAKKQTPFAAALRDVPPAYRSDLYNWLRGKYRDLAKLANKPKPNWTEIAAKVAAEGPIGANGQAVVPNNLRRMWLRLDRDMKQEEAERLAKRVQSLASTDRWAARGGPCDAPGPDASQGPRAGAPPTACRSPDRRLRARRASFYSPEAADGRRPPPRSQGPARQAPQGTDRLGPQAAWNLAGTNDGQDRHHPSEASGR